MGRRRGRSWAEVLTPEFLERELAEGRSVAEMAAAVGCAENTVRSYLAAHRLEAPATRRTPAPDPEELAEAYAAGGSIAAVGERYGVSFNVARRWLLQAGVALQPPRRPARDTLDVAGAARRYRSGESLAAIAKDLQVSRRTLRERLRAAGVATRPPGRRRRADD